MSRHWSERPWQTPLCRLGEEEGISRATFAKWRAEAQAKGKLLPEADAHVEGWTSQDKLAAVIETAALNEAEPGDYCRRRGIFPEQIAIWREACEQANDWDRTASARVARECAGTMAPVAPRKPAAQGRQEAHQGPGTGIGAQGEGSGGSRGAAGAEKKGGGDLGVTRGPAEPDRAVLWTDPSIDRPEPCDGPGRRADGEDE